MSEIEVVPRERRMMLAPLFAQHAPTFLIDTVLEGHAGTAWADDARDPHVAMLAYADVVMYGGDAEHPAARELARRLFVYKGVWPAPGGWQALLEGMYGTRVIAVTRYAFSDASLDPAHLQALARRVPAGFSVRRVDIDLAHHIVAESGPVLEDHVRQFDSPADFVARGAGFVVTQGNQIVAAASSYAACNRGIEVQVSTDPGYRRRGLATVVSANLIADGLARGFQVHWDAANQESAALAQKLGYTPAGTYEMLVRVA